MKELQLIEGIKIAEGLAQYNEGGRLLVSSGRVRSYLIEKKLRLKGLDAQGSAEKIITELGKGERHYEYEPGKIHLYVSKKAK